MWSGNFIGVGEASSLVAFGGLSFQQNVLCAPLERVALVNYELVACNSCLPLGERAETVICGLPTRSAVEGRDAGDAYQDLNPACPQLDRAPPVCNPPLVAPGAR